MGAHRRPGGSRRSFLVLALALGTFGALRPASAREDPEDLGWLLEPIAAQHGVPGMACAIVREEGAVALGCTGVRRLGSDAKVEPDDLWHLGSCTKAMTATLVARLVERDVLSWETTLGELFAERVEGMDARWKPVTLRQLLAHRAGMSETMEEGGLWTRLENHRGTPVEQRWTLVEGVLAIAPLDAPGERFRYSNAGFAVAGAAAEMRAGVPWEELMRREVFEPLGMNDAGFGAPGTPGALDQPLGHEPTPGGLRPRELGPGDDNPASIGPAGTVHATMADWARFVACHLRAGRGGDGYLKPETFAELHTPAQGQSYVAGWVVERALGSTSTVLRHAGSNTLWFSLVEAFPEKGFAVLVATNAGGAKAEQACQAAATELVQVASW